MDINALLSPDDSHTSTTSSGSGARQAAQEQSSSAQSSPQRKPARVRLGAGRRTASGLSNEITRSPESPSTSPPSRPVSGYGSPSFSASQPGQFRAMPPTSNPAQPAPGELQPAQLRYGHAQPLQQRPAVRHRQSSTPQMETLADLASMQTRPPPLRAFSANNADITDAQRSPLIAPPISRSISRQSLADLTMAEAPSQTPPPRDFTAATLSESESKTVTDLLSYLSQHSYAYEQHVELIQLLHKGFLAHVDPPIDDAVSSGATDPHSYALLAEMRQAREAMDSRFVVGEAIWVDWLSDEIRLARSSDERIAVTELFSKAVQDEPASVKLWLCYTDWISTNLNACYNLEGSEHRGWSAEDNELCRELFTKDMLLNVLEQAVSSTQWRIDESHLVWNRYAEFVHGEFPQSPSPTDVERLRGLFIQRLQVPHAAWNETAQSFWPVVSKFEGQDWEALMATVNELAAPAKRAMALRNEHESKLQRAMQTADAKTIQAEFDAYLRWEKNLKLKNRSPFDFDLRCALYERALLSTPTYMECWLDYIDFITTAPSSRSQSILPIIERATRHCPWSGDLWGRRILRADVEKMSRDDIESTKHRATNSGLLDLGGLEEMVKMLQQWCSYLRRHAFSRANSEDDLDTAEVGIIAALENVKSEGKKLYGPKFQGDPLFRLEQVQIKFYTEGRRVNDARAIYRELATHHAHSFDFWSKYYNWELWLWGYDRMTEKHRVETAENGPHLATAVVQEALSQPDLDKPEMVLEMYLYHFQQHESCDRLQTALIEARTFSNRLTRKRAHEADEAAQAAAHQVRQYEANHTSGHDENDIPNGGKRKRDDESTVDGDKYKKSKTDEATQGVHNGPSPSIDTHARRDREHNTITLKNLPPQVQEIDIKKFLRDCGVILSVHVIGNKDGEWASATVEFESSEDVLAAQTRNGKELEGREIHVHKGGQNTLYVTNYPAEYDENAIRDLFKSYGEISSVRFPSLKYNSRRRFCYVTFLTSEMSHAAESAMDGTKLDGLHTLVAKISDPEAAKSRSGAQAEGREVFVKNVDREAPESEVQEFFAQYGTVVSIKLLKLVNDQRTGSGFVVFDNADQANTAVEEANNKPFRNRVIQVSISSSKSGAAPLERAKKTDIIVKHPHPTAPISPDSGRGPGSDTRRDSDVSMNSAIQQGDDSTYKTVRERKVAIFNIPDTVNDARIRAAMEQYGLIHKIQLRRDKEGAIVEFADVKDAFNVRQGVDVSVLGTDASTGDVGDLLARPKKRKEDPTHGSSHALAPPHGLRPGSIRGGRRGGLGFKRGAGSAGSEFHGRESTKTNTAATTSQGAKSNADFRNMLEQSKVEDGSKHSEE